MQVVTCNNKEVVFITFLLQKIRIKLKLFKIITVKKDANKYVK